MAFVLTPHPTAAVSPIDTMQVHFERQGPDLWLRFKLEGDVDALALPDIAAPQRRDDLWRRTCFEAFVATGDGYVEFNLSPSGEWASYRFDGYREGMRPADETVEVAGMDSGERYLALEATVVLPPDARRIGVSAVVETQDGSISYWALAHPSDKPDFHHPDSFVLTLPEPA